MVILAVIFAFLCIWFPISYYAIRNLYRRYSELKQLYDKNVRYTTELEDAVKVLDVKRLEDSYAGHDHDVLLFVQRLRKVQGTIQEDN